MVVFVLAGWARLEYVEGSDGPGSPSGVRPEVCVSDSSVKRHERPRHFPTDGDAAHISDSGATGKTVGAPVRVVLAGVMSKRSNLAPARTKWTR